MLRGNSFLVASASFVYLYSKEGYHFRGDRFDRTSYGDDEETPAEFGISDYTYQSDFGTGKYHYGNHYRSSVGNTQYLGGQKPDFGGKRWAASSGQIPSYGAHTSIRYTGPDAPK